jgi:hypothetical protein
VSAGDSGSGIVTVERAGGVAAGLPPGAT